MIIQSETHHHRQEYEMKRSMGFTLIELLVVIAIISLLVSILLPTLNEARHLAKMTVCASNVHNIMSGAGIYASDNGGILPPNTSTSQGSMDTFFLGINCFYGPAILVKGDYLSSKSLYSPEDEGVASYAENWPMPYEHPYLIFYSYTFREPLDGSQQANPNAGGYVEPYEIDKIGSFVSDRFSRNYIFSFHKLAGSPDVPNNSYPEGNGKGWHVGFTDGHVTFYDNDPDIYYYGNEVGAAGGWGNRYLNWTYWESK
jgi:prepilin-type N-terminal cleavage/methylation domain-containing protein